MRPEVTEKIRHRTYELEHLVGPYGCGKSSILNLVNYHLKEGNKAKSNDGAQSVITCHVEGWGLARKSAGEHIIKQVVRSLSKYLDCVALAELPFEYQEALSNSGTAWGKMASCLLGAGEGPIAVLSRLDRVLAALPASLIIHLEDLDRNEDNLLLGEVASLLDNLKDLERVTFLFAIGTKHTDANVLLRIADHVESVPCMEEDYGVRVLAVFREACLSRFPDDFDPVNRETREQRLRILALKGRLCEPLIEIPRLLSSPRLLKTALRRTDRTWNSLHGEIDFDDLLVANALRFGAEEMFYRIVREPDAFRCAQEKRERAKDILHNLGGPDPLEKRMKESFPDVGWDREAARGLASFLFPKWGEMIPPQNCGPQCLGRYPSPTNYWSRFQAEEVGQNETRDQEVIRAIRSWKEGKETPVFRGGALPSALLASRDLSEKVEQFGFLLDGREIRDLAAGLFEKALLGEGSRQPYGDPGPKPKYFPGFRELWRVACERPFEKHEDWVIGQIRKALSKDLRLANDIYYYWRSCEKIASAQKSTPKIREKMVAAGRELFESNPGLLSQVIHTDWIWAVYHFSVAYSSPDHGGNGFNPSEWTWLADVLLEAGKENPGTIALQIIPLVVHTARGWESETHKFLYDKAEALFANRMAELMTLLATEVDVSELDLFDQARVLFAGEEARKWLAN